MDSSRVRRLIESIGAQIAEFAPRYSFVRVDEHEWLRRWGWKNDGIRVCTQKYSGVIVNFEVSIPPIPGSACHCHIGIINLSNLMGDTRGILYFPKIPLRDVKFIDNIAGALPLGMAWLSKYDTPRLCLDHLLMEHVNPQSNAYKHAQVYLQNLPAETNDRCCLLNLKYDFPNEYMKALFDIRHRGLLPKPP